MSQSPSWSNTNRGSHRVLKSNPDFIDFMELDVAEIAHAMLASLEYEPVENRRSILVPRSEAPLLHEESDHKWRIGPNLWRPDLLEGKLQVHYEVLLSQLRLWFEQGGKGVGILSVELGRIFSLRLLQKSDQC